MKRKICLLTVAFMLLSLFAINFSVAADTIDEFPELIAYEGLPVIKGELGVTTTVFVDPADFEGEGPFDFFGVSVSEIELLHSSKDSDFYIYFIILTPETDTVEAYKTLSEAEEIRYVDFNSISFPSEFQHDFPEDSPYIGRDIEELNRVIWFVPDEVTVYLKYELDMTEFEGESEHYLFGVNIQEINKIDSEDEGVYGYNIRLRNQRTIKPQEIRVLECNENVVSVDYKSTYGNGDINADGKVDSYDYILAKRMHFETYRPPHHELGYADVNRDSYVNVYDYILLKRVHFGTYTIG